MVNSSDTIISKGEDGLKVIKLDGGIIYEVTDRSKIIILDDEMFSDSDVIKRITIADIFKPQELTVFDESLFEEIGVFTYLRIKVSDLSETINTDFLIKWKDHLQKKKYIRMMMARKNPSYIW